MASVWIVAEHRDGRLKKVTLQALGIGKTIAESLQEECVAVVLGESVEKIAQELASYADRVLCVEHPLLEPYRTQSYLQALMALAQQKPPSYLLMGHTAAMGRDLAPRLAARLMAGCVADCTEIAIEGENIFLTKPVYAGKAFVKLDIESPVKIVTIRPNAFPAAAAHAEAPIDKAAVELSEEKLQTKCLEVQKTGGARPELTEAEVVVSGGRGIKGPENFHIFEELADTLGAAVGASRAVVDAGWRPHAEQVGQTGKTISPNLYLGFGVSGAIQHLAGMSSSKVIVAVNTDPEAPIFKVATYGIVGDLFQIVPLLKEELAKLKAQG